MKAQRVPDPATRLLSSRYHSLYPFYKINHLIFVDFIQDDRNWDEGICAAHGFGMRWGKGKDGNLDVDVNY
jgi:hypothetical protein